MCVCVCVCAIYMFHSIVSEYEQVCFPRFRISNHSLTLDTVRWSRRSRGRLPLEERLYECGQIEAELHVSEQCVLTQHIRDNYNYSCLREIFACLFRDAHPCHIAYLILSMYRR